MSDRLKNVKVRQLPGMGESGSVLSLGCEATAVEAAKAIANNHVGCLMVLGDDGRVAGILSERDVVRKVVAERADPGDTRVADIMTTRLISCTLETSLDDAQHLMATHAIRHLPVIEDGFAVGMISIRDILLYQLMALQETARLQTRFLSEVEANG